MHSAEHNVTRFQQRTRRKAPPTDGPDERLWRCVPPLNSPTISVFLFLAMWLHCHDCSRGDLPFLVSVCVSGEFHHAHGGLLHSGCVTCH